MKYTILINQKSVVDAGFHTQTDLVDWAILDYIDTWQKSNKAQILNGYVWLNYKHLIQEMPLLGLKAKQSVSDRISKLRKLNLLESIQDDDNRLFVKTTPLFFDITHFSPTSDDDDKGVRQTGQGVRQTGQGVRQTGQGVRQTGHSINNKNIQSKHTITTTTGEPPPKHELQSDVVVVVEKAFLKKEDVLKAIELLKSVNPELHKPILNALAVAKVDKSKIGVLRGIIKNALAGDFTAVDAPKPAQAQETAAERLKREEIATKREQERHQAARRTGDADLAAKLAMVKGAFA